MDQAESLKLLREAISAGLEFGTALGEFAKHNSDRDRQIITMARDFACDGELEIDDPGSIASEGDDNGSYVLAWVWVDFAGTPLDKEKEEEEEEA